MAKKNDVHIVRTVHTVARSETGLIVPPLILIPTAVVVAIWMNGQFADVPGADAPVDFRYLAAVIGFLLLFPIWAKLKTRFTTRYLVTLDSVVEEHGLLSKTSSEIRIHDIRNIVVKQSILDRILMMGNISFSSAAGTGVEVKFHKVAKPNTLKVLVRDIQGKLSDGELTEQEIREIGETAGKAPRKAKPSAEADAAEQEGTEAVTDKKSPPAVVPPTLAEEVAASDTGELTTDDESTREELYRLLAEQQSEE
jgi:uncharacterized membrane protein YdbT with pleckstrin-like domain